MVARIYSLKIMVHDSNYFNTFAYYVEALNLHSSVDKPPPPPPPSPPLHGHDPSFLLYLFSNPSPNFDFSVKYCPSEICNKTKDKLTRESYFFVFRKLTC